MAKDYSKGRGKYKDNILLKYIQLPHKIYEILFIKYQKSPRLVRALACLDFIEHYFTNQGYSGLLVDPLLGNMQNEAYAIADVMNEATYNVQNNARWMCFDEFYMGRNDLDYEAAFDLYEQRKKEKRKAYDAKRYEQKKLEKDIPQYLSGREELKKKAEEKGLQWNDNY